MGRRLRVLVAGLCAVIAMATAANAMEAEFAVGVGERSALSARLDRIFSTLNIGVLMYQESLRMSSPGPDVSVDPIRHLHQLDAVYYSSEAGGIEWAAGVARVHRSQRGAVFRDQDNDGIEEKHQVIILRDSKLSPYARIGVTIESGGWVARGEVEATSLGAGFHIFGGRQLEYLTLGIGYRSLPDPAWRSGAFVAATLDILSF